MIKVFNDKMSRFEPCMSDKMRKSEQQNRLRQIHQKGGSILGKKVGVNDEIGGSFRPKIGRWREKEKILAFCGYLIMILVIMIMILIILLGEA